MLGTFVDPGLLWAVLLCLWPVAMVGMLGAGGCCQNCTICSDDFNRANDTDIDTGSACGWTEASGSAEIASNALSLTSANTLVACDSVADSGTIAVRVTATVSGATNNDAIKLYVKDAAGDGQDCYYAEIIIGSNKTLRIYEVIAGVANLRATTTGTITSTSTAYEFTVCYSEVGMVVGRINGYAVRWISGGTNSTRHYALLGTGAVTSAVTIDDFSYEYGEATSGSNQECAPCRSCVRWCDESTVGTEMQVELTGLVNAAPGGGGFCNSCTDFNSTFILSFRGDYCTPSLCVWQLELDPVICDDSGIGGVNPIALASLSLTNGAAGARTGELFFSTQGAVGCDDGQSSCELFFQKTGLASDDCGQFSATEFPVVSFNGCGYTECNISSATSYVTSL